MGFISLNFFVMQEYAYEQFIKRGKLLTNKLLEQEYQGLRLKPPLSKFHCRYNDLVSKYNVPLGHMLSDVFHTC